MKPPFTSIVAGLPATVPFVAPEELERRSGRPFRLRLGANESPFGCSPLAREAMAAALENIEWYGDPECHDLRAALSLRLRVGMENISVGSGIDGLLGLIARAYVEPGAVVVTSLGSYPTFSYHVEGFGGCLERISYLDGYNDLQALADTARRTNARVVYLANPDNPTGTWYTAPDIRRFKDALPEDCLFILDEAYAEFLPSMDLLPIVSADPRIIRLRTFSKAYGMAGARVGYAIAAEETIAAFQKIRNHFGVNRIAQAGAIAALEDEAFLASVLRDVGAGREHYHRIAASLGWPTLPSGANFVAFDLGTHEAATKLLTNLRDKDIFVRTPGAAPLNRYVRITVGTPNQRVELEHALRGIVNVTT